MHYLNSSVSENFLSDVSLPATSGLSPSAFNPCSVNSLANSVLLDIAKCTFLPLSLKLLATLITLKYGY